ncbi:carbohydrate kinase family protein [Tautonia marina]|uniref:carbohydrate kinase family protein n=1 Tax=Tautonia marina TaxID=2653855 RepID=UPI0012606DDA|nr:carbohydrate kinase family protein [Tautonia marina]
MRTFVTGSIAYDYIMVFPGKFREHILPEKMHVLSVSFLVDSLKRQRGGTGANIAYNLALLGNRPMLVGAVGEDFGEYHKWLEQHGVDLSGVKTHSGEFTSSCFINNDLQDNQITAFYPGAMVHAAAVSPIEFGASDRDLVVIAPNDPKAMARYAAECTERGIPYLYDPSMQIPRMSKEEFEEGCKGAKVLIGNDYEFGMMAEKLGVAEQELHQRVPITVVTKGEAGATIVADGQSFDIPPAKPNQVVDPTGAGDAFRAGLITGMARGLSWPTAGRIAALTAVHAVEHMGPQEHSYSIAEFVERYRANYGASDEVETLLK